MYRPSRAFVICVATLLTTAGVGAWAWNKANSTSLLVRSMGDFYHAIIQKDKFGSNFPIEDERIRNREVIQSKLKELRVKFPALSITPKPVPDDRNGFLLLYQLSGPPLFKNTLTITRELEDLLTGRSAWNPELARKCLAENSELVSRVEFIASLETRSSEHMPPDYIGFFGARTPKSAMDILCVKARLAAERKDEAETLRCVRGALNLGAHYREVETPNLLGETVAILLDLEARKFVFEHLLPALGKDADLSQWKSVLTSSSYTPAAFAKVMRGEWNSVTVDYMLPCIFAAANSDSPSEKQAFMEIEAGGFEAQVKRLPGLTLAELVNDPGPLPANGFSDRSKTNQEIAKILFIGSKGWHKGFVRCASTIAQYQAALDLMIEEKNGTSLDSSRSALATADPFTGKPFVFDPAARTVAVPPGITDVKPLRLPW